MPHPVPWQGDGRAQRALFVERLSRLGSVANRARVARRIPVHPSSVGLALMANQPLPCSTQIGIIGAGPARTSRPVLPPFYA